MGGCVCGSVGQLVGLGQMTKHLINLDLIEMIQFYLICRGIVTHVWVIGWVSGSIGHFWTFYLNHLSPLWGYFFIRTLLEDLGGG